MKPIITYTTLIRNSTFCHLIVKIKDFCQIRYWHRAAKKFQKQCEYTIISNFSPEVNDKIPGLLKVSTNIKIKT